MTPMSEQQPGSVAPTPEPDDPRVLRAVEEYQAACQAGCRPERGEFLAHHADIAPALAECLDGLEFIQAAAPRLQDSAGDLAIGPAPVGTGAEAGQLGDYRLLREVGRGGMGVVYEAEQISLGRRVALKVLPFAAALDARRLLRFQNEARAAACLHHTHIVPVYAVGCERGVHYYAMQYIDGQTLAALLHQLRRQAGREPDADDDGVAGALAEDLASGRWAPPRPQARGPMTTGPYAPPPAHARRPTADAPTSPFPSPPGSPSGAGFLGSAAYFRTVAQLGVQAAEALEHAHTLGVVHRDIKPSNLLVDGLGQLWVTDFGLAQVQSDTRLTLSGDLLGTLRYMSPEQALARRVVIDHRTDLYSLGVTLYELLALEPAFPGAERQEVLRQIAFEEPQPPARHNKAVPRELETVVLKAMAKNPAERYATAQDLADDLRRFLQDKPIRARRPTVVQRARKWVRRHPGVTWMGVALLAVLAVGSAVSTVIVAEQLHRAEQAEQDRRAERDRALRAEGEVTANLQKAQAAEREKTEELWRAKLAQAQAGRLSGRAGSVFASLKALAEAAEIARRLGLPEGDILKLRNEAIACMALPDLRRIKDWDRYTPNIRGAALDPCLRRYTTTDAQGNISIHDMADDQVILRLKGPGLGVWSVGFSPDCTFLHAIYPLDAQSTRGRIWIWDLHRGEIVFRLEPEFSEPKMIWSPDSRRFVVHGREATVAVYDVDQHKEASRFSAGVTPQRNPEPSQRVAFHPHGKELAVLGSCVRGTGTTPVELRDIDTGKLVGRFAFPVQVDRFAWGGAGRFLAGTPPDDSPGMGAIYLWDVPAGRMHAVLAGHGSMVTDLAFNHSGDLLASTSWDGTLRLWNPWDGKELVRSHEAVWGRPLEFSPDDRFLSVTDGWSAARLWWEVKTGRGFRTLYNPAGGFGAVCFSPTGRFLLASEEPRGFWLLDLATCEHLALLPAGTGLPSFERTGSSLLTASSGGIWRWPFSLKEDETSQVLRIGPPAKLDLTNGRIRTPDERTLAAAQQGRALSPDGRWVATGSWHGDGAKVWDAQSGKLVRHLTMVDGSNVCFSPDSKWLVTGSGPEYVFWEVGSWKPGVRIARNRGYLGGVMAFSPDAALLAIANSTWDAQLIEAGTGRQVATLSNLESQALIGHPTFSPDGSQLAVVSAPVEARPGGVPLHLLDLRVIRQQLAEIGLDWHLPPYPAPPPWQEGHVKPLQVQLDLGELAGAALGSDDRENWIARGRYFAEHGQRRQADAAFARAAALTPDELHKFIDAGWWVVGPYPEDLRLPCPPEEDPDPSRPVAAAGKTAGSGGTALTSVSPSLNWQYAPTEQFGRVELGSLFTNPDNISAYALTYVFSCEERSAMLLVSGGKAIRVWLNGRLVHEDTQAFWSKQDPVPVTLRAGRNTLLAKVSKPATKTPSFALRLADSPIDRGLTLAELGLWEEAAPLVAQGYGREESYWEELYRLHFHAILSRATGNVDAYRELCEGMFDGFGTNPDYSAARVVIETCALGPEGTRDPAGLLRLAEQRLAKYPTDDWCRFALGLAYYRAGRFEEALRHWSEPRYEVGKTCAALAMAHHRLGHVEEARNWLAKADGWCDQVTREVLDAPVFSLRPWGGWGELARFQIIQREAEVLIAGSARKADANRKALQARAREELRRRDKATADYDHALSLHPDQPRLWLARGRRFAELKQWDRADADLAKAAALGPKDPEVWRERGRVHAEAGRPEQAAADFARAEALARDTKKGSANGGR